jgi:5-methylcytosine-specific restriction protein B
MKIFIKKVPDNEIGSGTEIAILKTYFDNNLIDDPRDFIGSDDNEGSKSYPINVEFDNENYNYLIKAYKTQNYGKDRRLIINSSADPLGTNRRKGDYLCYIFEDKITRNSAVLIKIISKANNLFELIENRYDSRNGLVADNNNNSDIYNLLVSNIKTINMPLNQILYGPPGTGKTDSTIEISLQILGMSSNEVDIKKRREDNRVEFKKLLNKKIFFVSMHPSYSYEDFVQGIKPTTSQSDELLFKTKDGIFKRVAELSIPYLLTRYFAGFMMSIYEDEVKNIVNSSYNQQQLLEYLGTRCGVSGGTIKNFRDYFDKVLGDLSPRKGYDDDNFERNKIDKNLYINLSTSFLKVPKNMLLSAFKNHWLNNEFSILEELEENNNVVLIIDEINRANISKVFGELITLIEQDKRSGNENELSVILPSGDNFSVPNNLYIIGTMNTADKSIALVDIALRRRFQFVPVYPNAEVIKNFCKSSDKEEKSKFMTAINLRLRNDKGVDFQIGHAYFLNENSLNDVINENIVPLLIEYFRNDLEKVRGLMKDLNRSIDEDHYNNTGLLKYIG